LPADPGLTAVNGLELMHVTTDGTHNRMNFCGGNGKTPASLRALRLQVARKAARVQSSLVTNMSHHVAEFFQANDE
jgi:hypothetical protein